MILLFPLLASIAQAPEAPASQPAAQQASGTARDVTADLTIIFELGERELNVQEDWQLSTNGKTVPASEIHIPAPRGARGVRVEERTGKGFHANETMTGIDATESISGSRSFTSGFLYNITSDPVAFSRPLPFALHEGRIVVQDVPGLSVSANVETHRRTHDMNGHSFVIFDIQSMPTNGTLDITLSNLPSHTAWPKRAALAAIAGIIVWMIWALKTRAVPGAEGAEPSFGPLSAHARRDQIVKAIEVLENDFREERVKEKKYERRHKELMKELATVLREIDLERQAASGRPA
jgi:hypothetical protein